MSPSRRNRARALLLALCTALLALGAVAPTQAAFDDPIFVFDPSKLPKEPPPPFPPFEGPCGVAVDSNGYFYVSDYYHHLVDVFGLASSFPPKPNDPLNPYYISQAKKVDPLDGPCGLALNSAGALYVNNYHRNVEKFVPSIFPPSPTTTYASAGVLDTASPTGVAVDPVTGNVYIDARTQIAAYDSTGTELAPVGAEGAIEDGYGLAVSGFPTTLGRLYVPDAATDTVKVFDPVTDADDPVQVIDGSDTPSGGFGSLHDSAIAVDNVTGEIYVADTLGPQFTEKPKATIQVFDSSGAYEGQLKHQVIDGSPAGLAVDNSATSTQGRVYVTSGNSENAVLYVYPPGAATMASVPAFAPSSGGGEGGSSPTAVASGSAANREGASPRASASSIAQKGTLRISVNGKLAPKALPRKGTAPISVSVGGEVTTTDKSLPPQLKAIRIELNKEGRLYYAGLPTCPYERIQPASTQRALSACRSALVGEGSFAANITLAGQEPYPTKGKLLVFNAKEGGKPVLFGQIYAARPFATSFVIVFKLQKLSKGSYGTALSASLPSALGTWGNLTGIEMTLSRRYQANGHSHSYISAGCPAPKGFGQAVFPLARTSFGFEGGEELTSVLSGTCRVRR